MKCIGEVTGNHSFGKHGFGVLSLMEEKIKSHDHLPGH